MKHIDWDAEMGTRLSGVWISAETDSVEWCVDFRALLLPGLATGAVVALDSWAALRRHEDLYLQGRATRPCLRENDALLGDREHAVLDHLLSLKK